MRQSVVIKLNPRLILVLIILAGLVGAFLLGGMKKHNSDHQASNGPVAQLKQASFPVYYPNHLPSSLYVDQSTIKVSKPLVSYSILSTKGERFVLTDQPLPDPSKFDFDGFRRKFIEPHEFGVPAGQALIGAAGAQLLASVQGQSWVLITAPSLDDSSQLESIVSDLQLVQ